MIETIITNLSLIIIAIINGYGVYKIAQLKAHINSRMDNLLKLTEKTFFAEGKLVGENEEKERGMLLKLTEKASFAEGKLVGESEEKER